MGSMHFDRMRFVIADDSTHMRRIIRAILHSLGAREIYEAEDGAVALEIVESQQPDILITDWVMPVIDGIELVQFIRNPKGRTPFLPIIMLTGYTEKGRIQQARDAGVTEFLAKPISATALYERIQSIVELPRPFVKAKGYFGPCRRRQKKNFKGEGRREQDNRALLDDKASHEKVAV
ncbi:MAG TPA: response regulator [Rhizobiales bacterium]|nr:response regulator [Hyphomicrobiales bacterium]